jgi:hypothetical protein
MHNVGRMRRWLAATLLALLGAWGGACGAFSLNDVADDGGRKDAPGGGRDASSGDSGEVADSPTPPKDTGDAECIPDGSPCSCPRPITTLTPGPASVAAIAVAGGVVYWISPWGSGNAAAYSLPADSDDVASPSPYTKLSYQQDDLFPSYDGRFYVGSLKGVTDFPVATKGDADTLVTTSIAANGLVVGPGGVYWTNDLAEVCHSPFVDLMPPKVDASCGGDALVPPVDGGAGTTPNHLSINTTDVYLAVTELGQIRMTPIKGGKSERIVKGNAGQRLVFASDEDLVWSFNTDSKDSGTLTRSLPDGGEAAVIATSEPIQAILIDGSNIYFSTSAGGGRIAKVAREGGPITVLACDTHQPSAFAVDGTFLYWGDRYTAGIWKVPK